MRRYRLLILAAILPAVLAAAAGGCAAPAEVATARKVQAAALRNYLVNDARIDAAIGDLWMRSRDKEIAQTAETATRRAIEAVGVPRVALDAKGKPTGPAVVTLTAAEAVELSGAIHTAIQGQNAKTAAVLAKLKAVRDANARNLTQYAELNDVLTDYLAAGIDATTMGALTAYLVETVTTKLQEK